MAQRRVRLEGKYRLITRSDLDGVVSAMLFQERGYVESVLFAHPKDMQDGTLSVTPRDIIVNLPFVPGCALAFDRRDPKDLPPDLDNLPNLVCETGEGSVSRMVYTWLGGRLSFPRLDQNMLAAVDKAVLANYSIEEILNPKDWVLLAFLLDARTGLGRFREFRQSNYQLLMNLIPFCRSHDIGEILRHPDVAERVQVYQEHQGRCQEQIRRCTQIQGLVGVVDLRQEETIWAGNRFLIYALFPEIEVSMHVMWGLRRQNTVIAVGRSIFGKNNKVNLGELVAKYQGGGHAAAGTCQVSHELSGQVLQELVNHINNAIKN